MFNKAKNEKKLRPKAKIDDLLLVAQKSNEQILELTPDHFYVKDNIRKIINEHDIEERAVSMRENGQLQLITVYPADSEGRYEIDKGQCRWLAAKRINGFKLKAVIDIEAPKRNAQQKIIGQFVENDSRSKMSMIDEIDALEKLRSSGMKQDEIAVAVGWLKKGTDQPNVNKVSRVLSATKLSTKGKELIKQGIVSDYITLEFLRKIEAKNETLFDSLHSQAMNTGILTRKEAESAFNQLKQVSSKVKSPLSDKKPEKNKQTKSEQKNLEVSIKNKPVLGPFVRVEWNLEKEGVLVLDQETEDGFVMVKLDEGMLIEAELNELKIIGIMR